MSAPGNEPYQLAERLAELARILDEHRARGSDTAQTLAEQREYRKGYTDALRLVSSLAFALLVEG